MTASFRIPTRLRVAALILLALLPMLVHLEATAQTSDDRDVVDIRITATFGQITEPGTSWYAGDQLHVRDQAVEFSISGDLSGTATLVRDLDWAGPCDGPAGTCTGPQDMFASVELVTESARWSGSLALELALDAAPMAHGILIGRHGALDQVIVLSGVESLAAEALTLTGTLVTLDGPIGGIELSHSACLTGAQTADGGFLGTRGLIQDNGPARIKRQTLGSGAPLGVYGDILDIGQKGRLRSLFIAATNANHAYGSFVLAGESGPYAGMLGYGRAVVTLADDPRCASGVLATSSWTGQARFVTDPATFLAPRVAFRTPTDGARVSTPIQVELVAEHVDIEPAGAARDGAGYLVIIVDAPCVGPGEPIPVDDQHLHLTGGETAGALSLFSGPHRLCLQLANGAGIAQPATDVITIVVAPSDGGGGNL